MGSLVLLSLTGAATDVLDLDAGDLILSVLVLDVDFDSSAFTFSSIAVASLLSEVISDGA